LSKEYRSLSESIEINRTLARSFTGIDASVVTVRVTVSERHDGLKLRGEQHVLEEIESEVVDGILTLGPKSQSSFSTSVPIEIELSVSTLDTVRASAGARVTVKGLQGDRVRVGAVSGAQVKVEGTIGQLSAFAESGGTVDVSRLKTGNVSSQASSGGRIVS
jgi:hypothetical protein